MILVGCKTALSAPSPAQIDQSEKGSATYLQNLNAEDRKSYGDLNPNTMDVGYTAQVAASLHFASVLSSGSTSHGPVAVI